MSSHGQFTSFEMALQASEVYRSREGAISPRYRPLTDSVHTNLAEADNAQQESGTAIHTPLEPPLETPSTLGGRRLELRGGSPSPPRNLPRLRGGAGNASKGSSTSSVRKLGRRLLFLLCTIGAAERTESPVNLQPIRVHHPYVDPLASGHAKAAVPASIKERIDARRRKSADEPSGRRNVSPEPTPRRNTEPAVIKRSTLQERSHADASAQQTASHSQQHTPRLRGGGRSMKCFIVPGLSNDDTSLPRSLWYLAGGRGKPITVGQWRAQKPKKRMGGLLGMALYGSKAGKPYEEKPPVVDMSADGVVDVEINVTPDEGEKADSGETKEPSEEVGAAQQSPPNEGNGDDAEKEDEGNDEGKAGSSSSSSGSSVDATTTAMGDPATEGHETPSGGGQQEGEGDKGIGETQQNAANQDHGENQDSGANQGSGGNQENACNQN
ncbi:hypothetical protein M011DRAFT_478433, partial [Sporormia fimetaria CBS 119925]